MADSGAKYGLVVSAMAVLDKPKLRLEKKFRTTLPFDQQWITPEGVPVLPRINSSAIAGPLGAFFARHNQIHKQKHHDERRNKQKTQQQRDGGKDNNSGNPCSDCAFHSSDLRGTFFTSKDRVKRLLPGRLQDHADKSQGDEDWRKYQHAHQNWDRCHAHEKPSNNRAARTLHRDNSFRRDPLLIER
jgi:hypothetical protein